MIDARSLTIGHGVLTAWLDRVLAFRVLLWILRRPRSIVGHPALGDMDKSSSARRAARGYLYFFLPTSSEKSMGMDGSEQMLTEVFGALFLGFLGGSSLAIRACLWFVAA